MTAAATGAAAGTTKLSSPTPAKSGPGGGSSDLLQRPVRSHKVLPCPCSSIVFGLSGESSVANLSNVLLLFSHIYHAAQCRASHHFAFVLVNHTGCGL